jgi:hypothetical protein
MNKPVNVLNVELHKTVSGYNLESGEVGTTIQGYILFKEQIVIDNVENETIRNKVIEIVEKNYVNFETVKTGVIFEESRICFQTFEDAEGYIVDKETEYFVDNDLYIEVNQGNVTTEELKAIFPEIEEY